MRSTPPLILVIEDNPDHAALIRGLLSSGLAAHVPLASSGWQTKAYFRGDWPYDEPRAYALPDLIVLDLGLPDVSGLELLSWLKENEALVHIPVMVLTLSSDPKDERRAYELGADHYMAKPQNFGALVEAARNVLQTRETTAAESSESA